MADKRCDNGHYIDESWDICPYCPQPAEEQIPVVQPRAKREPRRVPTAAGRAVVKGDAAAPAVPAVTRNEPLDGDSAKVERTVVVRGTESDPTQSRRYVVGWLVGLSGPVRGESYPVRMGRNVLGRDRRSDVVVNDEQASAHHADLVFRPEEARFILMDHNSTNGTYVNEAEIAPRRDLAGRDVVRIGTHRFLFIPLCGEERMWDEEGELR